MIEELDSNILVLSSRKDEESAGMAYFKEDKLVGVSESVAEIHGDEPNQIIKVLFFLISRFNEEERFNSTIKTEIIKDGETNIKKIMFVFREKRISVLILDGKEIDRQIIIQEDLSSDEM
jgi:hypothetical protein